MIFGLVFKSFYLQKGPPILELLDGMVFKRSKMEWLWGYFNRIIFILKDNAIR